MADVSSKNIYALLGNTSDQDSDREPAAPTKTVDAQNQRRGKRDAPKDAPNAPTTGGDRSGRGGRRGGATGNEQAFRDRDAGRNSNRGKPIDDNVREDRHSNQIRGGRIQSNYEGRGGRGGSRGGGGGGRGGRAVRDDRHSRTGIADHQKQVDQGWGGHTGEAEWNDEQAGAAIAAADEKAAVAEGEWNASAAGGAPGWDDSTPANVDGAEARATRESQEEEDARDSHISYADYLASKTKDLSLGVLEARKPNKSTGNAKLDKKFAGAKEVVREDEEYFVGTEQKSRRERERKGKNLLDIDYAFHEAPRESGGRGRGGRGEGRGSRGEGGRGRGSYRGDRSGSGSGPAGGDENSAPTGDGEGRGGGRGGGFRGRGEGGRGRGRGRGDGERGSYRGGRGRGGGGPNAPGPSVDDQEAFPSLGSK